MYKTVVYALILLGSVIRIGAAATPTLHEFKLENGLKLIVQEDHRAPVVVSQVWYKVGGSYEHDGITGLSHMLEHMMFKGTEKLSVGEFSRIVSRNGGRENAFTSRDYTAYYEQLEQSRLPVAFELEADRMRSLIMEEAEFLKEQKVVMEERRLRTEDNPQSLAYEKAMAVAYQTSPYRQPVVGWMADIENYTLDKLRDWYVKWYAPDNAIVVVVGDVDPNAVHSLAKKHFGPLASGDITPPQPRPEVKQDGEKRVTIRKQEAKVPYVFLGYKVPSLKGALDDPEQIPEQEIYALEMLSGILDGGNSARLTKRLVRGHQIAVSAGAGYDLYARLGTLFTLMGIPAPGQDVATLESALRAEVRLLQEEPIEPAELERIKTQVITSNIYQQDGLAHRATEIGSLESVGLGWQVKDSYVDKVNAVTVEQIQAVARKYLVDDELTVAVLEPRKPEGDEPQQGATSKGK